MDRCLAMWSTKCQWNQFFPSTVCSQAPKMVVEKNSPQKSPKNSHPMLDWHGMPPVSPRLLLSAYLATHEREEGRRGQKHMETREASALFVLLFLLAPSAFSLFSGKTFAYSYFSLLRCQNGGPGHRSLYLPHAKRTLYHLS